MRDQVAVTSLAMPARARETQLTELIYTVHPRFAGVERVHGWRTEHVEGGDVLLLAPGVSRSGVGERTTPAGAERLAREVFADGLAHTVLAVPIAQERATMHLDTVCTMVDVDKVVMYPNVADTLSRTPSRVASQRPTRRTSSSVVARAEPFLVAAAKAMGIDTLHQIDTGLDPVTAEREQWDDGNNTLAIAPRVAVAYERNVETNEPARATPASRSSRSRAPSSAPAEAARAACRAPSHATRCRAHSADWRPLERTLQGLCTGICTGFCTGLWAWRTRPLLTGDTATTGFG